MSLLNKNFNLFIIFLVFVCLQINYLKANELYNIKDDEFILGNIDAPITMIEYASLSCPHCAAFHVKKLPIIKEEYIDTGKVKLIFRDFPLNLPALQASMVTHCVGEELYFKYLNALFSLQRSWVKKDGAKDHLFKIVQNGGMTEDEFNSCLSNKELENKILTHQLEAHQQFKIKTTPSFVINGKLIEGNKPIEEFRKVFDEILLN